MLAASYERLGGARDVLGMSEMPTPEPGPGEVRVRLRCSGVNPSDVKSRGGVMGRAMPFPVIIPHSDGAGDIDAVGPGVDMARVGQRVWTWNAQWKRAFGTAAEYVTLPAAQAVQLPEGVGYAEGACFGIPALTAWQAVRLAGAEPGRTLLVAGGAGAVGHYAIQIARARGARVVTTVSGPEKAAMARDAGADEVIDRRAEDVAARVSAAGGVDAVVEVDFTANAALVPGVLRPHGTAVVYGISGPATIPAPWMLMNSITVQFMLVYELPEADRTAAENGLRALLQTGALRHSVALRLPLSDIAAAHEAVESGKVTGNVVLDIAQRWVGDRRTAI